MLREKSYAPLTVLPPHSHDHGTLILVLDGGFREECGGENVARRPGELRVMPAAAPHSNAYGSAETRCFITELHGPWLAELASRSRAMDRVAHCSVGTTRAALARRMYEQFRIGDDAAALSVEGLLLEALGESLRDVGRRASPAAPHWLLAVRDRLHDAFAHPPALPELAREAGVHPAHLHRAFRAHFSCTPGDYVRALRIDWARRELVRTTDALSFIALRAGFSDQAHFTRCFRSALGVTPAEYRRLRGAPQGLPAGD